MFNLFILGYMSYFQLFSCICSILLRSYLLSLSRREAELAAGSSDGEIRIFSFEGGAIEIKEELKVCGEASLKEISILFWSIF